MEFRLFDNILMISYLLAWVFTLIWYQRKEKAFDAWESLHPVQIVDDEDEDNIDEEDE